MVLLIIILALISTFLFVTQLHQILIGFSVILTPDSSKKHLFLLCALYVKLELQKTLKIKSILRLTNLVGQAPQFYSRLDVQILQVCCRLDIAIPLFKELSASLWR